MQPRSLISHPASHKSNFSRFKKRLRPRNSTCVQYSKRECGQTWQPFKIRILGEAACLSELRRVDDLGRPAAKVTIAFTQHVSIAIPVHEYFQSDSPESRVVSERVPTAIGFQDPRPPRLCRAQNGRRGRSTRHSRRKSSLYSIVLRTPKSSAK